MKRTLILVRHGKSSWEEQGLPDRARPLAERGLRDAPLMGRRLAHDKVRPDLILSSPACRALSTAHIIAETLGYRPEEIVTDERLYGADVRTLLEVMGELGDELRCVMLFGHDPEFTDLAHRFSGKITRMPTCAVARFTFDAPSWSAAVSQTPLTAVLDYPKKG
ncbi:MULTISPECIES: SixA phosphatase family protein [Aeromonas]|uniref:SixA phosphatase family protein n=1 Tax=Aeromonas TaxID=642 RepID=UPI001CCDF41F|nr:MULTISPECIES: histidine phosphatase family protein [Aeromonas]MCS3458990.1 phosphohistidine phosphatase [Aeromonas sp. BIGb0445]UBO72403.1 histidine phosphatase family protein [Aeromonas rivuli]